MPDDKTPLMQKRLKEATETPPGELQIRTRAVREAVYDRDPLKLYIRKKGWLAPVKEYVGTMRAHAVNRHIKYVTLPGFQAIDIGIMWKAGIIHREEGIWTNVAICDQQYAADVINNLGEFAAYSQNWLDRELRNPRSQLKDFFPVDVANLDFWGAFLEEGTAEYQITRNLNAVKQIIDLQLGQQFLLLLTHKISESAYTADTKKEFQMLIESNLADETFKRAYQATFGGTDFSLCTKDLLQFILLAVSKTMANLACQNGYNLDEKFTGWYERYDYARSRYQMGVQSLLFLPIGNDNPKKNYEPKYPRRRLSDPAFRRLTPQIQAEANKGYLDFVSQLPGRAPINVKSILDSNRSLKKSLTREAEQWQNWWKDLQDG
jgi:hypothetical protein